MGRQSHIIRSPKHPFGTFSDGNQGSVVFDGSSTVLGLVPSGNVYTLTADIEVQNMTVNSGITVLCNGFVPRVNGVLKNLGRMTGRYNDANGSTPGAAISATGSLQAAAAAGGAGRSTTGTGNNGTGSGSRNITGAAGGSGGNADGVNVGGSGNNTVAATAAQGKVRNFGFLTRGRLADGLSGNGSGGGGAGGCNVGTGTATSGGGGSSAIPVQIFCRYLDNQGTIDANGGNGGNASATGNGKAGGGGGGAAGCVFIVTDAVINLGTIQANGGIGGNGVGGAGNGSNGTNSFYNIFLPNGVITG